MSVQYSNLLLSLLAVLLFVWVFIWYNNKYSSFRNKKFLLKQEPFLGLQQLGFQLTDDAYIQEDGKPDMPVPAFLGLMDGYAVEICFNWITGWSRHPHYRVRVLFEPGSRVLEEIQNRFEEKLAQSKLFRWQDNLVFKPTYAEQKIFVSKTYWPKAQALAEAAAELIKELRCLELEPVAYCEGVALARKRSGGR